MSQPEEERQPARSLSFDMHDDIAALLLELRNVVRGAGHARPSQKVFVEALIQAAEKDGRKLELEVLAPYRLTHPDMDT
jgi:hypothetical protein